MIINIRTVHPPKRTKLEIKKSKKKGASKRVERRRWEREGGEERKETRRGERSERGREERKF